MSHDRTYARCFGKPNCRSVCNGVKCCFEIFVGVGFFRGGSVAMTVLRLLTFIPQAGQSPRELSRTTNQISRGDIYKISRSDLATKNRSLVKKQNEGKNIIYDIAINSNYLSKVHLTVSNFH